MREASWGEVVAGDVSALTWSAAGALCGSCAVVPLPFMRVHSIDEDSRESLYYPASVERCARGC